jgi:uncharacterized membrane protein
MRTQPISRIELIDIARGGALVAMAIYHFAWDLEFFGYLEPGTTELGLWKLFARAIASSFLFLVGVSLFLAHARGVRLPAFLRRFAIIVAAALAISVATWFAVPDGFIFFGILHQIALASVVGLLFLRLPAPLTLIAAALAIAAPHFLRSTFFDHPALWWVGLSSADPPSNDYVPLFPWVGAVLAGIAAARLADDFGALGPLARIVPGRWSRPLIFAGRHSLAFYLIHQPVLIGLVWTAAQIFPPPTVPVESRFLDACVASCEGVREGDFCPRYCGCMLDRLAAEGRLDDLFAGGQDAEAQARLNDMAASCTFETDAQPGEGGDGQ